MKKDYTKLFVGLMIVIIGTSLLFGQLGLESIFGFSLSYLFSILWPLILVLIGGSIWLSGKNSGGLIILAIGLFFLLNTLFDIDIFSIFWPLLLIALGLLILFKGSAKQSAVKASTNFITTNSIFSGSEKKITSKNFEGANVFVLFGGSDLDLRDAKISKEGAQIDLTVAFGGCEIYVPKDTQVVSEGSAFLGGWDNKADGANTENAPVLKISGSVMFGGVEIK